MADSKIKVITVTSDPTNQGVHNLIGSLTMFGWDFQVIPCIWQGFGTKIIKTYEYLKEHPEIEHFIFCDANDVVVLSDEAEFLSKVPYSELMLCSAEKNCWPKKELADQYPETRSPFKYINSGLYYSHSLTFISLFETLPPKHSDDDQLWMTKNYLNTFLGIHLDRFQNVFNSYSFIEDGEYEYKDGRLHIMGNTPIFIHGNGRTDMTKVLELLK